MLAVPARPLGLSNPTSTNAALDSTADSDTLEEQPGGGDTFQAELDASFYDYSEAIEGPPPSASPAEALQTAFLEPGAELDEPPTNATLRFDTELQQEVEGLLHIESAQTAVFTQGLDILSVGQGLLVSTVNGWIARASIAGVSLSVQDGVPHIRLDLKLEPDAWRKGTGGQGGAE